MPRHYSICAFFRQMPNALLLCEFGPNLGRPTVDGLKGSKHANMKELRFSWETRGLRVAFAFDRC